jgi:hypothetical protein
MKLVIEFFTTDGPGDGGSKLSMVEGLLLLHMLSGADGDVIVVHSLRNVIMCKITARPHGPVQ